MLRNVKLKKWFNGRQGRRCGRQSRDQVQCGRRSDPGSPDVGNAADAKSVGENRHSLRLGQTSYATTVGLNNVQAALFEQCLHSKTSKLGFASSDGDIESIMKPPVAF